MLSDLFEDHRQMVGIGRELLALVRREPRARPEEITQLRVRLSNLAKRHLRNKDAMIFTPLIASGRIDELPGAAEVIADIRKAHGIYSDHVGKWTIKAVEADREGYAEALVWMIDFLRALIVREESILYWPALRLLHPANKPGEGD
jgi:hypothetical protein